MNPDAFTSDGSYTFKWDAIPVEWNDAWAQPFPQSPGTYTVHTSPHTSQPQTTQFPSPIWEKEMVMGPRKHVCVLCGDLDASPVCEECRIIFNEFKTYFKKRQFKELMDELTEMDE